LWVRGSLSREAKGGRGGDFIEKMYGGGDETGSGVIAAAGLIALEEGNRPGQAAHRSLRNARAVGGRGLREIRGLRNRIRRRCGSNIVIFECEGIGKGRRLELCELLYGRGILAGRIRLRMRCGWLRMWMWIGREIEGGLWSRLQDCGDAGTQGREREERRGGGLVAVVGIYF